MLVEAAILEVSIDERQEMGFDWITSTGGADGAMMVRSDFANKLPDLLSNPAGLSGFTLAAASAGTLTIGDVTIPTQTLLLSALKSNSNVNLLWSPNILTADNEEAEIKVGENVPFLTGTGTNETNLNNTFNQIDRQDVGITLRITPQISSGDSVTLKIFTEVSQVTEVSKELGPTTRQRKSETTVITKDSADDRHWRANRGWR